MNDARLYNGARGERPRKGAQKNVFGANILYIDWEVLCILYDASDSGKIWEHFRGFVVLITNGP